MSEPMQAPQRASLFAALSVAAPLFCTGVGVLLSFERREPLGFVATAILAALLGLSFAGTSFWRKERLWGLALMGIAVGLMPALLLTYVALTFQLRF